MLKEAINRILELAAPNKIELDNRVYIDKEMTEIQRFRYAAPLQVHTLSAVVDYVQRQADERALDDGRFIIHVADYNSVLLYRELDADKKREHLITATIDNCKYPFGRWLDLETFIINLQSAFVQSDSLLSLASMAGNIVNESGVSQKDDGISQQVTVKKGVSLVGNATVPNPIALQPYRTFTEIEQPESSFVFRLREGMEKSVTAALFEADGSEWKRCAIHRIADWFRAELDTDDVIILA